MIVRWMTSVNPDGSWVSNPSFLYVEIARRSAATAKDPTLIQVLMIELKGLFFLIGWFIVCLLVAYTFSTMGAPLFPILATISLSISPSVGVGFALRSRLNDFRNGK